MNRNLYLNVLATLIFIALTLFGLAFVSSVDSLRASVEALKSKVASLEDRVSARSLQASAPAPVQANSAEQAPKPAQKAANAEFYDLKAIEGDRFITAIKADTKNMNMLVNNDHYVGEIWGSVTESLAERNYKDLSKFEPMLAESWSVSDDKLTYDIKLRKGVLWHDFKDPVSGKEWKDVEVKADDFKFYVDVIKNPETDCAPMRVYLNDLEGVEVVSDYEFKVRWSKKYFESFEITLGLLPLPRHLYHAYEGPFDPKKFNDDHERNRIVVGCGPYRFDSWGKGQRVILKKWDKYYGRALGVMPPINTLSLDIIPHPSTRFQALLSKDLDEIDLEPDQWINRTNIPEFGENGFLKKISFPARMYRYLGYNLKSPIFQDKRVRQALTCLVDRERIKKDIYYNLGRVTSGPFFMDTPYYDKSIEPWPFSIEKAKALLKEAGWADSDGDGILDKDGKKFEFSIMFDNANSIYSKMLPIIKEDMAKAGVQMNLMGLEWSVVIERLEKKNFDACCMGWGLGLSPDQYQLWHSSQADLDHSSNFISFKNPEADRLIEEMRVCFDDQKRIEMAHQFHRLLHEEQPYTFLINPFALEAINTRYQNMQVFPTGVPSRILWTPKDRQLAVPGL